MTREKEVLFSKSGFVKPGPRIALGKLYIFIYLR